MPVTMTAAEAVGTLDPLDHVLLPPGCSEAVAIQRELVAQRDRLAGMSIASGLLLGDYEFLDDAAYRYSTWHVMGPVRDRIASGDVAFFPVRASSVVSLFTDGHLPLDVVVVHVSSPDRHGFCSFGVSASYPMTVARVAPKVIALVNAQMPRVFGSARMHVSEFDIVVEVDEPLIEYRGTAIDDISATIGSLVASLVPDDAILQIGIGSIPEAVLESVAAAGRRGLTLWGMGTDSIVPLVEQGVLGTRTRPAVMSAELMGSAALFEFVADNPLVVMEPFDYILDPARMADMGQMIAVNSAVQIDLSGQVNAESVNGRQISGVGGSFDFVRGALDSPGGRVVVALPAEAGRGRFSRIVTQLDPGAPVNIPRHHVQTVVTEHGIAHLEGLSLRGRAEGLIAIASPDFREQLTASLPYLEDKTRVTSRAEACP